MQFARKALILILNELRLGEIMPKAEKSNLCYSYCFISRERGSTYILIFLLFFSLRILYFILSITYILNT